MKLKIAVDIWYSAEIYTWDACELYWNAWLRSWLLCFKSKSCQCASWKAVEGIWTEYLTCHWPGSAFAVVEGWGVING